MTPINHGRPCKIVTRRRNYSTNTQEIIDEKRGTFVMFGYGDPQNDFGGIETTAIVELDDGTLIETLPGKIQFTDKERF